MAIEKHNLIFGGISANAYGIYVESGQTVYNGPARATEIVNVPGRNGALVIDKGYYENITIEYPCFTYADDQVEFRKILTDFKNAILSQKGYQKLVDTYHPDEYRYAVYIDGLEITPDTFGFVGDFTLKFNCKPQRYLESGEEESTVTNDMSLINPTLFDAEPLIKLDGYGTVAFNGYSINVTHEEVSGYNPIWTAKQDSKTVPSNHTDNLPGSITVTFDKSVFNTGDEFTFDASFRYAGAAGDSRTITHTNNNATLGSWVMYSNGVEGYFEDAFNGVVFYVGTASTLTDTVTFTTTGRVNTTTITFTVAYDGNQTVTVTFGRTFTNLMGLSRILRISDGIGTSTISVGEDIIYVDCELGEAYTFNNGSVVSVNDNVALGSDLPKLAPGENTFTISNTFDEVTVVPRWWRL